jgi:hypothetical protein
MPAGSAGFQQVCFEPIGKPSGCFDVSEEKKDGCHVRSRASRTKRTGDASGDSQIRTIF